MYVCVYDSALSIDRLSYSMLIICYAAGGTIALFLGYETYMVALAQDASKDSKISSTSVISKHIFAIVGIVLLLAAGIFCNTSLKPPTKIDVIIVVIITRH